MNVAQIIAQMRRKAKVNTTQYSDADALIDLNTLKDETWSAIVSSTDQSYNWERWETDTVALQSEYTLASVAYNTAGTKVLSEVEITYDSTTFDDTGSLVYVKATRVDPTSLPNSWEWYEENQSVSTPIYYIADNSIFIAPMPRSGEAGTNYLRLTGTRKIADWSTGTAEADMKLPVDQANNLVYGLIVHALENKGVDEALIIAAENRWLRKRREMIATLEARATGPSFLFYPDSTSPDVVTGE